MKNTALAASLMAIVIATPAGAADTYTLDPAHTFPSFEINHLGFSTQRGRFNSTSGKITLDPAAKTGSVEITVDAASIDTGLAKLEEHLRKEDFFNVEKFPTITYRGNSLHFEGDKLVGVDGELTMLGVTRPASLTVTSFKCGRHPISLHRHACGADAYTVLKRSEFGMTKYVPAVSDEVRLLIAVEALKD